MIKLKGLLTESTKHIPIDSDIYSIGDMIDINPKYFIGYTFTNGTHGKIIDIDKSDYASDSVSITVKLKHIEPDDTHSEKLNIDNYLQIK